LQNVLCRAVRVCRGSQILPSHLDFPEIDNGPSTPRRDAEGDEVLAVLRQAILRAWDDERPSLWPYLRDLLERELLAFALARLDGNQTKVAERLDMARNTVIKRTQEYGLK
jgi:DNA-binding NtrC family response regulator